MQALHATLFPYTTLFRSPRGSAVAEVGADDLMDRREDLQEHERHAHEGQRLDEARALLNRGDELPHGDRENRRENAANDEQDRKSTRLNSSHLGISYAVF